MKILITGTYCSGKSTLSKQLCSKLQNAKLVEEVPREVLHLFGKVDWTIPELRHYIFLKQLIEEKKAALLKKNYIVVDAGIISILAHDDILMEVKPKRGKLLEYFNHEQYDIVFYCDHTEIEIEDDGERYTDAWMRNQIANKIVEILCYKKYIKLKGSKSERLSIALNNIQLCNDGK